MTTLDTWEDIGFRLTRKCAVAHDDYCDRIVKGLKFGERTIVKEFAEDIYGPYGETGYPTGVFGIIRTWDGKVGIIHIPKNFASNDPVPSICWMDSDVMHLRYWGAGEFVKLNSRMEVIGKIKA